MLILKIFFDSSLKVGRNCNVFRWVEFDLSGDVRYLLLVFGMVRWRHVLSSVLRHIDYRSGGFLWKVWENVKGLCPWAIDFLTFP